MGLFSSARARRASRAATLQNSNGDGPGPAEPSLVPAGGAGPTTLRDSLQQLYKIRPSREAFSEEALKLLAKAAGVKAAIVLGYEPRKSRVYLLASIGLEREALQILSSESTAGAWDIPLRSVRNRRINVIESAHENPFVPKPLAAISPRRLTIAALPFYHAATPVGVAVFFSPTQRGFTDGLLHTLSQALRICALALSELPSAAPASQKSAAEPLNPEQPNLLRGLAALKNELARLHQALEETERQRASEAAERVTAQSFLHATRERTTLLEQEISTLRADLEGLPAFEEQIQSLNQRLHDAVQATESERAQVAQLQAALAVTEQKADGGASAVAALTAARDEVQAALAAALAARREREEEAAALEARLAEVAARAEKLGDVERTAAAAEQARNELAARLARLEHELAGAREEIERRGRALSEATAALDVARTQARTVGARLAETESRVESLDVEQRNAVGLRDRLQAIEAERAELLRQVEALRDSIAAKDSEHETAAVAWKSRYVEWETERTRLREELERAQTQSAGTVAKLQAEMQAAANQQQDLTGRLDSLSRADGDAKRLRGRVEELEHDLLAAQETTRTLEGRIEELGQVSSRLIAERRELHDRIEKLAAGGQTREQEKQAAINAAQRRVTEVEDQLAQLAATLESTRAAAAEDLSRTRGEAERTLDAVRRELTDALGHRDTLRDQLQRAERDLGGRQGTISELSGEHARLSQTLEKLTTERAELAARAEAAAADVKALRQAGEESGRRIATLEGQLGSARDQLLGDTEARIKKLREEHAAAQAELRGRHADELAGVQSELERARAEHEEGIEALANEKEHLAELLAEKELLLQSAEEGLTIQLPDAEADGDTLEIDRSSAPENEDSAAYDWSAGETEEEPAVAQEIVLFEDGEIGAATAHQLSEFGHHITPLAPDPEATTQLGERAVACAAINLAIPSAWRTLRHLRNGNGHTHMPLIAYALAGNVPKGFWLGSVDFAVLPAGECDLAERLSRLVPKVKRVIAMSNDIDVMSDVRNCLNNTKISTAVVLDGRQALDLVSTVRPEAAVLHLSPSCVDVFRAVAGLRSSEISRDIPIIFLLDQEAQPREEAFLSAGVRMLSGRGNLVREELVGLLDSALNAYRYA